MAAITVTGESLGAAAAAARLAKLGHTVTYVGDPNTIGGHWRRHLPPVIQLPATWRDLSRKSGRQLSAELARQDLELSPAPAARHLFSDGLTLELPAERGAQYAAISHTLGRAAAASWRDLLDDLDDLWIAVRQFGIEAPRVEKLTKQQARLLWRGRTMADLANRVGEDHLAQLVLSIGYRCGTDSNQAPAALATRLVIERTFDRWQLTNAAQPIPATKLLDLLADRLATRRVRFAAAAEDDGSTRLAFERSLPPKRFWGTPITPALAPIVRRRTADQPAEEVTHTADGPIVSWFDQEHDYTASFPDLAWGYAPDNWAAWAGTPPSASAGNEPWAELANAALTVYQLHKELTGQDVRPSNRNYRP